MFVSHNLFHLANHLAMINACQESIRLLEITAELININLESATIVEDALLQT